MKREGREGEGRGREGKGGEKGREGRKEGLPILCTLVSAFQKLSIFRTSHVSCCSQAMYRNRQNLVVASGERNNKN